MLQNLTKKKKKQKKVLPYHFVTVRTQGFLLSHSPLLQEQIRAVNVPQVLRQRQKLRLQRWTPHYPVSARKQSISRVCSNKIMIL